MINQESVRKINEKLIQSDGKMKPFTIQLLEYEYGLYPDYLPFVISNTTMFMNGADVENYPLIINQSTVKKIKTKHDINNSFIMHLEKMLRNNVLIMESRQHKETLVIVTDYFDKEDNPVIITMRRGFSSGHVSTNQITSIYGKRHLKELIEATYNDGLIFYPNKKTRHFITSQRLQLPPDVMHVLSYDYNIPYKAFCQDRKDKHKKEALEEQIADCVRFNKRFPKHNRSNIRTYKNVWDNVR